MKLDEDPQGITLEVSDDGPGFAPEIEKRAFERFARGDHARTRGGTRRVRVRPERGRLSTALVLQGRGPAVLTLAYPGDRTFGSQRVSRRI